MLTDDEIDRITDVQWAANNHKPIYAAHRAYARAIEAAIAAAPQPSAEPSELVRAARGAIVAMLAAVQQNEHDMLMTGEECRAINAAIDALRRALDEPEAKGGERG